MQDGIKFGINDPNNALKRIKAFPDAMKKKGVRFAMRKGANLVAEQAKKNALALDDPETASIIAENVAVRFSNRRFKKTGAIMFRVGVLGGARNYADTRDNRRKQRVGQQYKTDGSSSNPGGDTWHWRLLEFGTSRTKAHPFMRPALEQNINKATNEVVKHLDRWIGRNIKKIGK